MGLWSMWRRPAGGSLTAGRQQRQETGPLFTLNDLLTVALCLGIVLAIWHYGSESLPPEEPAVTQFDKEDPRSEATRKMHNEALRKVYGER